jgi:hypothetical protein
MTPIAGLWSLTGGRLYAMKTVLPYNARVCVQDGCRLTGAGLALVGLHLHGVRYLRVRPAGEGRTSS